MFTSGLSQAQVLTMVQTALLQHRGGLEALEHLYAWSAGVSAADLVTAFGFSTDDASSILSAIADGHAEYLVHTTGQAPGTYPQVTGTPYVYSASQSSVIGPVNP